MTTDTTAIDIQNQNNPFLDSTPLPFQVPQIETLNISQNQLTFFPSSLPLSIRHLIISINNIIAVPNELANLLPRLTYFNLDHNQLWEFPSSLPPSLQHLSLTGNQYISEIKNLAYLSNLTHLNLSQTGIHIFPTGLPTSLQHIQLNYTELQSIPKNLDRLLPCLTYLSLDHNKLLEFPSNLPPTLQQLSLVGNDIPSIPNNMDKLFPNLVSLNLEANKISKFPATCILTLKLLNIGNNEISSFSENLSELFPFLEHLELSNALITSLPKSLKSCLYLQKLLVTHTAIDSIPLETLKNHRNLTHLNLKYNTSLKFLSDDIFQGLVALEDLNLSYCPLSILPTSITSCSALKVLDISSTNIESIPKGIFSKFNNLISLYISADKYQQWRIDGVFQGFSLRNMEVFNHETTIHLY